MKAAGAIREDRAAPLPLPDGEIHVWRIRLDAPEPSSPELRASLSADERERAERFCFEKDRRRFAQARAALRAILSGYLGERAEELRFRVGPHGKPGLAPPHGRTGLRFNLSHSGELALCAVASGRELGVDLEAVRPVPDAETIAERFFSAGEVAALRRLPPARRLVGFFRCWTRKEAYLKALGDGLACPLDSFEVSLGTGDPAPLLRVHGNPAETFRWSLRALDVGQGYVAALVTEGRGGRPMDREWSWVAAPAANPSHGRG